MENKYFIYLFMILALGVTQCQTASPISAPEQGDTELYEDSLDMTGGDPGDPIPDPVVPGGQGLDGEVFDNDELSFVGNPRPNDPNRPNPVPITNDRCAEDHHCADKMICVDGRCVEEDVAYDEATDGPSGATGEQAPDSDEIKATEGEPESEFDRPIRPNVLLKSLDSAI